MNEPTMHEFSDLFAAPGSWYRGNLHTHTTESDGAYSPAETAAWYREHGYDLVVVTDHNRLTDVDGLSDPGFLVLPGIEVHPDCDALGEPYHIVAAGVSCEVSFTRADPAQAAIDALREQGAVVWLGHPYWIGMTLPEMIDLQGTIGLEVYNATCARVGKGLSTVHWDDLLARGRLPLALAVDDCHADQDLGRGWVMVKATELSREAILQALSAGRFYATQGPEIHDVQVTGDEVYVRCSPVCEITCVSLAGSGSQVVAADSGEGLTEATFSLRRCRVYLRIECTDAQGRVAWSQPMLL